jgi:hypothetical protein
MAKTGRGAYDVGFGRPPQLTQFKPGQSGNPSGRPRGAKNFATALEEELNTRVTVTENGRRRRISKREVIAKHLVNKAASGDLKAIPLLLNEARARETNSVNPAAEAVLDTPEDQKVLENVLRRLQSSLPESLLSPPTAEDAGAEAIRPSDRAGK